MIQYEPKELDETPYLVPDLELTGHWKAGHWVIAVRQNEKQNEWVRT